jgi:hypothetical protein
MRLTNAILAAAVAATMASQAVAGGFAPVVVDPEPVVVVEPEQPRSTFGFLLPIGLAAGLVALAIAAEDDTTEDDD